MTKRRIPTALKWLAVPAAGLAFYGAVLAGVEFSKQDATPSEVTVRVELDEQGRLANTTTVTARPN